MYNYFFVANSAYSLYQYLLMKKGKTDDTLFVLGPAIDQADVPNKITFIPPADSEHPAFGKSLVNKIKRAVNNSSAHGYINFSTPQTLELSHKFSVSALSDGLSDLTLFPKYLKTPSIQHCYATSLESAPKEASNKLSFIDLKKEWQRLTLNEQKKIATVFGVTPKELEILKTKKVILITQPLSEDGIVTEIDKQRLYKSILSNYSPDEIVIKPHPREKTNWSLLFPDTPIISRRVPAELLSDMINLKKVCTFFSTAAFGMTTPENVDIYSKDFGQLTFSHPNKKMGKMPYVDIEQAYGHLPFNWKHIPDDYFYKKSIHNRTLFMKNQNNNER